MHSVKSEAPATAGTTPAARRWSSVAPVGLLGGLAIVLAATAHRAGQLNAAKATLLGAVEGLTEFLPISSSGHLLVTERLLGLGTGSGKAAADVFAIAIQLGAILAVTGLYRERITSTLTSLATRRSTGRALIIRLALAFIPAAVIGLFFGQTITDHLFSPVPIILAWAIGGIALLLWRPQPGTTPIEGITIRTALIIGTAQVLALWPGTSRSLVTILAALAAGLTVSAAVEFSFLLGLITLVAASTLDLAKHGPELLDRFGWRLPLLGGIVAALAGYASARWFVTRITAHSLSKFGWYRICVALITTVLVAMAVI